ncbi:unnamed protein product, partial [Adineta steineri]
PCPLCQVPITVSCFGQHRTETFACSSAHPFCCGQVCGRILKCRNHLCSRPCHIVTNAANTTDAGAECIQCEEMCTKERPVGCQHSCPLACHPNNCPPCKQRLRMRCHCNTEVIYSNCQTFTTATETEKEKIKSCCKPCTKKLTCGHSCAYSCHSGPCLPINNCVQAVQVRCVCKRINQELPCHEINTIKNYRLPCDELCAELKKNRMATASSSPVIQTPVEEIKPPAVEIDSPLAKRKNRKTPNSEPISTT